MKIIYSDLLVYHSPTCPEVMDKPSCSRSKINTNEFSTETFSTQKEKFLDLKMVDKHTWTLWETLQQKMNPIGQLSLFAQDSLVTAKPATSKQWSGRVMLEVMT